MAEGTTPLATTSYVFSNVGITAGIEYFARVQLETSDSTSAFSNVASLYAVQMPTWTNNFVNNPNQPKGSCAWYNSAVGAGQFLVAVGSQSGSNIDDPPLGCLGWSADSGASWTMLPYNDVGCPRGLWKSVAYSPSSSIFLAVDAGAPQLAITTNGQSWTTQPTPNNVQGVWVSWLRSRERFVLTTQSHGLWESTDATSWTQVYPGVGSPFYGMAQDLETNTVVSVQSTGSLVSTNSGVSWTASSFSSVQVFSGMFTVVWSPERHLFVAGGSFQPPGASETTSVIISSPDGILWTVRQKLDMQLDVGSSMISIVWTGKYFLGGVSLDNFPSTGYVPPLVYVSPDGFTWFLDSAAPTNAKWWFGATWNPTSQHLVMSGVEGFGSASFQS